MASAVAQVAQPAVSQSASLRRWKRCGASDAGFMDRDDFQGKGTYWDHEPWSEEDRKRPASRPSPGGRRRDRPAGFVGMSSLSGSFLPQGFNASADSLGVARQWRPTATKGRRGNGESLRKISSGAWNASIKIPERGDSRKGLLWLSIQTSRLKVVHVSSVNLQGCWPNPSPGCRRDPKSPLRRMMRRGWRFRCASMRKSTVSNQRTTTSPTPSRSVRLRMAF